MAVLPVKSSPWKLGMMFLECACLRKDRYNLPMVFHLAKRIREVVQKYHILGKSSWFPIVDNVKKRKVLNHRWAVAQLLALP